MNNIFADLWNRSFRTQLIYGFGVVLTILIVAFTYTTIKFQSNFLQNEAIQQAKNRSLALATTSKPWVMANDYVGLEEVIDNFSIYDDLIFTAIINMDGKIIGHSNKTLIGKYISDKERVAFLKESIEAKKTHNEENIVLLRNKQYIDIFRIIHQDNINLGLIHIRLDQVHRQSNIDTTIHQGLFFTIFSIIIGIVFAYFVANGLTKQLLSLLVTIKDLRGGHKGIKADEDGVKEISELSHEFNDLIETLHSSEELNEKLTEQLELAFIASKDGLWDWDIKNDTIYFSPLWKNMLGFNDDELPNKFSSWRDRIHPEDLKKALSDIKEHIDGKTQSYNNIHRLKHKNGDWIWTLDRGKALYDDDGTPLRMVGTHTDITEEKKLQIKYVEQSKMLLESQRIAKIGTWKLNLINDTLRWSDEIYNIFELDSSLVPSYELFLDSIHPHDRNQVNDAYLTSLKNQKPYKIIHRLLLKDGSIKYIKEQCETEFDEKGKPLVSIGSVQDITEQVKSQESLNNQYKLTESIIDTVPTRIFWKDRDGKYLGANRAFLGDAHLNSRDDIIGKDDFEMPWGEKEAKLYRADDLEVMSSGNAILNLEETQTDDKGNSITLLTSKVPLRNSEGETIGILGAYADVTVQRKTEEELKEQKGVIDYQAHHDALTGLPNRVLFNDRLKQAIEKAKRKKTTVALLFIDLDHFKEINDSLGHEIGDEVLKEVTKRLKHSIRDEDTLARLGGDEFTVILEDLAKGEDASLLATNILDTLAQPITIEEHILYVSSSIGISLYPNDKSSINLLKYADSAMYKAKDEGRNNFQFYSAEMTELALERVVMETSLREALEHENFVVYYQPQVNGTNDQLVGMEALVRWEDSTKGIVSPAKFIPLAESTGLIVEIDRFVMKTAMTQIAKWYADGLNPGVLAMNLSVKQLQKKDFISMFENLIIETKCRPEWIELEVTEGQIMDNPEESIKTLNSLKEIGLELAVDDFGTGYSSLSYLKKLPISKLKIDQSFVKDLPHGEEDVAITRAVIALAQSLNFRIIAEGVETKEQRDFIVQNGCSDIQGYFYSRPLPAKEFENILRDGFKE